MIDMRDDAYSRAWGHEFKMPAAVREQTILKGQDAAKTREIKTASMKSQLKNNIARHSGSFIVTLS